MYYTYPMFPCNSRHVASLRFHLNLKLRTPCLTPDAVYLSTVPTLRPRETPHKPELLHKKSHDTMMTTLRDSYARDP